MGIRPWKRVSGYPLSTNQYRPGFYGASLCLLSFLSWGWPHRRAGTDSDTSGLLPVEFLVLCVACHPWSILWGVISGRRTHLLSSWVVRVRCPSRSKADVLPVVAGPVDIARGVAARHLWKHSQIAASATRSTGGRSASFTCGGQVNLSRISIVAVTTPQATVAAKSWVDMVLWVTGGALALGVT